MSRYIDVDKIEFPIFESKADETWVKVAINATPTADVRENKHGEWVGAVDYCNHLAEKTGERYSPSGIGNMIYCNRCWQASDRKSDFCPNCGADTRKYLKHADSDTASGGLASAT